MSQEFQTFVNVQKQAVQLVGEEQIGEALAVLEEAKGNFPGRLDRLCHWKAGIFMLEGKSDGALAELEEGLSRGFWWNPEILLNDEELQPLKDTRPFHEIIECCREQYALEKGTSTAKLLVEGNKDAETAILSLHWKGSNAADFASQWRDSGVFSDYLIGFPQSSQLFSCNSYTWDERKVMEEDVQHSFQTFQDHYLSEEKNVVISGASQGGKAAVELALKNQGGFSGFIAFVPSFTDVREMEALLEGGFNKRGRGYIVTGKEDPFYEATVKMVHVLNESGIPCKLVVHAGMGHQLPEDFAEQLRQGVAFIQDL